jgi:putative glutamine amidotransferase
MKPVIGITSNYNDPEGEYVLRDFYVLSVHKAGGIAIILPPGESENIVEQYINICDGLIISGGGDIDPKNWGELPGNALGAINPRRDFFELILAEKALKKYLPVLGICRGCQILNVAAGGSLVQHIKGPMTHQQKAPRNYPFHDIVIAKGTILEKIIGIKNIRVNSFHHQAVKKPGLNLRISAYALDKTVEAIEGINQPFFLGVQWHPECLQDKYSTNLFKALVEAAHKYNGKHKHKRLS